jgi:hypothetical protein
MEEQSNPLSRGLYALLEGKSGGLVLNGLIVVLVILALILPPVSAQDRILGAGYTTIERDAGGAVVDPDGMQVTLLAEGLEENVKIKEEQVPMASFLDGSAGKDLVEAAKGLPSYLQVKSPLYQIQVKGGTASDAILSIPIPNNAEPYQTLSLYEWTGDGWRFVPGQVISEDDTIEAHLDYVPATIAVFQGEARSPQVSAELPEYVSLPEMGDQALAELNPLGYYLGPDNTVEGSLPSLPQLEGQETYSVLPTLRNWTDDGIVRSDLVDNLLIAPETREAHAQTIADLVVREMYAGIDLDYRGINPDLRAEYTAFVQLLAEKLHANGKQLSLHVEAPVQVAADRWETGAYDWKALGQAADVFKFPAIQDPAAYAPGGQMEALLWWAVGEVERYKVQPVFSARSVEVAGGVLMEVIYRDALAKLSRVVVENSGDYVVPGEQVQVSLDTVGIQFDPTLGRYWFSYVDEASGEQRTVWLEDASSLSHKLALLNSFDIGGVAMRALWDEGNDPRVWDLVRTYQTAAGAAGGPLDSTFSVLWSVEGASGQVSETESSLDQNGHTLTAPSEPGEYNIGASIVANGQTVAGAGQVALLVAEPTATPTPTFTPTPIPTDTPIPTETPTPEVTATPTPKATAKPSSGTPQPTKTPKPSNPPVNTNFGYGIQAHMVDNGQAGMVMSKVKDLGFGWIKQQMEWKHAEPAKGNYNWGAYDEIANAAQAAGVKVLWSVVKAPAWARGGQDLSVEGPPNNPQDFADFLGALAGRYCNSSVKAIEVWNEQNLFYEWGNQKIDPAAYMNLLKPAYNKIKAACPSMIVVSGALTPTGAPPPIAMDDYSYLEGMYKNGLKNYCDAVGAHPSGYNVAPSIKGGQAACDFITQQGSKFRGPCNTLHHSWSFNATLNGYYNIMKQYGDGNKKIWPTEFGWASGWTGTAGYEYADDNTLQEQADWTVQAYKLMKQWGFVGVAFLWNLNFRVVNPTGEVAQWGIVWSDWSPTPAYNALKAMPK